MRQSWCHSPINIPKFLFPGKTQFAEGKGPEDLKIFTRINAVNPVNWIKTAKFITQFKT